MAWVLLTLALFGTAGLHLWWRRRFRREGETFRRQSRELRAAHEQELALRDSRQKALLESMVEGLLVLDGEGRIRLASRAFSRMFGTPADVSGRTLLEVARLPELAALAASLDEKKQFDGYELRLAGSDERWVSVSGAALIRPDGAPEGKLLVFHDLTRIKKFERTRQEFVANVSHELRTPLSLIKGYAETLLDGAKDDPKVAAKFLGSIDRNAERLRQLIEDLLTISELESNRLSLDLQPVAARKAADKVLSDLAGRAAKRNVILVNRVPELTVVADPGRFEQVLVNLVDNGIKYGRVGGNVAVSATPVESNQVEFAVTDDGPGISGEALDRIFERFYREDKARSRDTGGTGLGLSIVKHIVQSHGGKVWATSELGHGAAFHFTLPCVQNAPIQ